MHGFLMCHVFMGSTNRKKTLVFCLWLSIKLEGIGGKFGKKTKKNKKNCPMPLLAWQGRKGSHRG